MAISNKDKDIFDWFDHQWMQYGPKWGSYQEAKSALFSDFVLSKPAYESQLIKELYDHKN